MNKSSLEQLASVQEVDIKLSHQRQSLEQLNETSGINAIVRQVKVLKTSLSELQTRLRSVQHERDELDEVSSRLMAKVKRMRAQEKSGAISHRDIATTEAEISHLESQRSDLEDKELEVLSEIELVEGEIASLKVSLADKEGELSGLRIIVEKSSEELSSNISELNRKRLELVEGIDPALLKIYESIHGRVGSVALAKVENSSCQGCRLKMSAVEVEGVKKVLQGEFSRPPTCEQCGRILYI